MVSLRGLSVLLGVAVSLVSALGQDITTNWPVHNNGLNKVFEWCVGEAQTLTLPYLNYHDAIYLYVSLG